MWVFADSVLNAELVLSCVESVRKRQPQNATIKITASGEHITQRMMKHF
jgi:hypothetical protein